MGQDDKIEKSIRIDYSKIDVKTDLLEKNGIIILGEEINSIASYTFCLDALFRWFNEEDPRAEPLWIVLNSPGGGVYEGFTIYDMIVALTKQGKEVNIVGIGMVASMAAFIMQAATKRYSLPCTQFLIHQIRESFYKEQEVDQAEERVKELKRLNDIVIGAIAKRSGMSPGKLKILAKKTDIWLNPEEAKNFGKKGIIDEIVETFPFFKNS